MDELFKIYFPDMAENVESWQDRCWFESIARFKDGSVWSYDRSEKTLRKLRSDTNNISEQECRKEFGYRLYKIMGLKGITQKQLSAMTGITQSMISNYITGKASPSFYNASKIAKAIGCSIEDFRYE